MFIYVTIDDADDALHLLALNNDGQWFVTDQMDFSPQNKKGDLICINTKLIPNKCVLSYHYKLIKQRTHLGVYRSRELKRGWVSGMFD